MTPQTPTTTEHLTNLRERIVARFDLEELRLLTFDLNVNYDELRGETLSAKTQALLEQLHRQERIPDLLTRLKQLRPSEEWDNLLPAEPGAISPYKGLLYFDEADAPLFFGREQVTAELLAHLRQHRFLAVVGASGSGKSSVIRAGVIPAIRRGEIADVQGGSAAWPVHLITPGDEPLKALAATLTRDSESVTATKTLLADLQTDSDSLDLFLYRQMGGGNGRCLLIVDQFEELFTQCRDAAAREMFVGNLVTAVTSGQQARLSLILTLRADFYAQAVQLEALRPLLQTRQIIIGAMTPDELRQAIEGPAAKGNWGLQPGLVETMLQDVGREPGALPLLSHALQETWARREGRMLTLAGYQAAGGVRRAIAQTADAVYASLTPEQQSMARNIFLRLTELGEGTEDTRRRVALAELLPEGEGETAVFDLLDLLARRRLVTLYETEAQPQAEVAHEALIRQWPRLRHWLDSDREALLLQRRLQIAAQEWHAHHQEPDLLYRGTRLTEIEQWAAQHQDQLNQKEQQFIQASLAERERHQAHEAQTRQIAADFQTEQRVGRVLRGVTVIIAILLLVALVAVWQAVTAWQLAERLQTAIQASQLVQASRAESAYDPELALLLAVAGLSLDRETKPETRFQLAEALQTPYRTTIRSVGVIRTAVFSPDDDAILTIECDQSSEDACLVNVARLWDKQGNLLSELIGHQASIDSVSFSSDGQTILTAGGDYNRQRDNSARLWDREGRQLVAFEGHERAVVSAKFSPDGQTILTTSFEGEARLWNRQGDLLVLFNAGENGIRQAEFSPDGQTVLTADVNLTARLWDKQGDLVATLNHDSLVNVIAFSPDGQTIFTADGLGTARLWNEQGDKEAQWQGPEWELNTAAFSPNGQMLLTISRDRGLHMWDMTTIPPVAVPIQAELVNAAAFNAEGTQIVTAHADGTARLWDLQGDPLALFVGHSDAVTRVRFSHDGAYILTTSQDGTAILWRQQGDSLALKHNQAVQITTFHPDGQMVLTASCDALAVYPNCATSSVKLWDREGREVAALNDVGAWVNTAVFSLDGQTVLIASGDYSDEGNPPGTGSNFIQLWDWERDIVVPLESYVHLALFSPDGQSVLTANAWGEVHFWDRQGRQQAVLADDAHWIDAAVFSPDGQFILTWNIWQGNEAQLWGRDGRLRHSLIGHEAEIVTAVFSRDGQTILTTGRDSTARLWTAQGEPLAVYDHEAWINLATFSPDEQTILSAGCEQATQIEGCHRSTIRLWDRQGNLLKSLDSGEREMRSVIFSPDGELILAAGQDGLARLWHREGSEIAILRSAQSSDLQIAFSPDGQTLLTASDNDLIRLWNRQGEQIAALNTPEGWIHTAMFSPDGQTILAISCAELFRDTCLVGAAQLWPTYTLPYMVQEAYARLKRGFTDTECQQYFRDQPSDCPQTRDALFGPLASYLPES